jgi:hypothetical protein
MRNMFAVGRLNRKTSELVLRTRREAPFPGPWKLRAVVGVPGGTRLESGARKPQVRVLPFPGVRPESE